WVPPGSPANWPGNTESPVVDLDKGIWSFSLWVVDDLGAISKPDTIKITVGSVVDPVVQQCADKVISTEPAAVRQCVCADDDMCSMAVTADKCDQSCWDLMKCVAAACPKFVMTMDVACLTMNCSAFLAGVNGATPAAPCFAMCPNDCMQSAVP